MHTAQWCAFSDAASKKLQPGGSETSPLSPPDSRRTRLLRFELRRILCAASPASVVVTTGGKNAVTICCIKHFGNSSRSFSADDSPYQPLKLRRTSGCRDDSGRQEKTGQQSSTAEPVQLSAILSSRDFSEVRQESRRRSRASAKVCRAFLQTRTIDGGQGGRRNDFLGKETLQDEMDQDVQCSVRADRYDGLGERRAVRFGRLQELRLC